MDKNNMDNNNMNIKNIDIKNIDKNKNPQPKGSNITIGISQGDFNGIGYEVLLNCFSDPRVLENFTPILYGSSKILSYYKKMVFERQGPLFVLFRAGILPPGGCGSPAASGGSSPSSMRLRCAMHWGQSTFLFHRPDAPGRRRSADCPAGPAPADGGLFPPRPASAGRAHRPDNPSALHPAPPEGPRRHNGARRRPAFRPRS